jgi:hypothetical protein
MDLAIALVVASVERLVLTSQQSFKDARLPDAREHAQHRANGVVLLDRTIGEYAQDI